MKFNEIIKLAQQTKDNVEIKKSASINKTKDYNTLAYLFSSTILRTKENGKGRDTGIKKIKANPNAHSTHINGGIGIKNCFELCKLMVNWADKHKDEAPAYLVFEGKQGKYKIDIEVWAYATARILLYYNVNKKFPERVLVTDKPFQDSVYTFHSIAQNAQQVTKNVEENRTASINQVRNYTTLAYLFSKSILNIGKAIELKRVAPHPEYQNGTDIDGGIGIKNCMKICELMVNWVDKHGTAPAYLKFNDYKIAIWVWTYAAARIILHYNVHKKFPQKVLVTSVPFKQPEPPKQEEPEPEPITDEVFEYFCNKFGSVSTIDGALSKIQGNGYGYYYDDIYSNKTSIDRMADGDGVNCTDSCQVFYHIGEALGYDVRCIHIYCQGGDGHVRLQFRHPVNTGGEWIDRDPASVLNGNEVSHIWCANGEYLATDPDWFMENLNR